MTFSITVPNASQSPGLFPAQANTNFQRIKEIVNNDHNWLDTAGASQGIHRQVTLINRDAPVGLPAGNGIVYSRDISGVAELFWYNGSTDNQITPVAAAPLKVTGSEVLNSGITSGNIYAVPANTQGTIFVNYISPSSSLWRYYLFYRSASGAAVVSVIAESSGTGRPAASAVGSNLRVTNGSASTQTVGYWINTVSF